MNPVDDDQADTTGQRSRPSPATYTRRRLLVASAVIGVPLAGWFRASGRSASGVADGQAPRALVPSPTTLAASTSPPVPAPPGGPTAITRDLTLGMVNDDVRMLQQRLHDLHFDPGPVDGWFGESTRRSVWAFEKLVLGVPREQATGVVTPTGWDLMREQETIAPRRSTNAQADHTEIYLPEQVMVVFHRDVPAVISHISSGELDANGEPAEWCELVSVDTDERGNPLEEPVERDICGISKTPGGVFEYTRRVEGIRNGALGSMWNPVYFNYGIAVHGGIDVPLQPVSHGCVRLPMHIADSFQDLVANGDRVLVWNGEQEPEDVSERDMLPVFDYANPDATTTTTSTTTTTMPGSTTTAIPLATSTSTSTSTSAPASAATTPTR